MFDIGCEQHGQYITLETDKEDKGDDEEPTAGAVPKWVAGQVTALHVKTPEEEEEERMLEEAEKAKAQLGKNYCAKLETLLCIKKGIRFISFWSSCIKDECNIVIFSKCINYLDVLLIKKYKHQFVVLVV